MNNKKSITILIGIIGVLLVLLAGALGYIIGNNGFNGSLKNTTIVDDKKVMKEIEELKAMYDSKIAEKTNNYKALKEEKQKVQNLVFELEKTKNDANSLVKYKTQYKALESKMKVLVNEIVVLKNKKTNVTIKQEKAQIAKTESKTKIVNASNENGIVSKKETVVVKPQVIKSKTDDFFTKKETSKAEVAEIKKVTPTVHSEKFSKITMSNVKAAAYSIKSGAKQVETTSSGKADFIKILFTLDENPSAKTGEKTYYIQIINSKNNVVGKRITEYFDSESLTYSLSKSINYNNQSTNCTIDFDYKDFEKGVYFINIFDRNELVGKSSFTLR